MRKRHASQYANFGSLQQSKSNSKQKVLQAILMLMAEFRLTDKKQELKKAIRIRLPGQGVSNAIKIEYLPPEWQPNDF